MASIMTNASALTALQSLNSTNKNLEVTQSRISTGYRVADGAIHVPAAPGFGIVFDDERVSNLVEQAGWSRGSR